MARQLASIQKILKLEPIEGKDRIELATVLGWKVIVNKGFNVGDFVVYVEIDSILPEGNKDFEFLRKNCYSEKKGGFFIRTMKMAGVVSQGIVFPMSILQDVIKKTNAFAIKLVEGSDVTELLDVKKWDPELAAEYAESGSPKKKGWKAALLRVPWIKKILLPENVRSEWPTSVPHTDETRLQALGDTWLHENFDEVECYATVKKDGQSATFGIIDGQFYVCSRNRNLSRPKGVVANFFHDNVLAKGPSTYWRIAKDLNIEKRLRGRRGGDIVIQGEICGPGIQGNKYQYKDLKFFVFNAMIRLSSAQQWRYLDFDELNYLTDYELGLERVPVLERNLIVTEKDSVESFVQYAIGNDPDFETPREGVVIRPKKSRAGKDGTGPVFGFKVINSEFLLKHNL